MSGSLSASAIVLTRFRALRVQHDAQQTYKLSQEDSNTSIELPAAIIRLITGPDFWVVAKSNRYRKLAREGHLRDLLELAAIALTKQHPANWFATVCSVRAWKRTLGFLKRLHEVHAKAERIVERIGREMAEHMRMFIYKQIWAGRSVERHAAAAQEIGKDRHKLFIYLCTQERRGP